MCVEQFYEYREIMFFFIRIVMFVFIFIIIYLLKSSSVFETPLFNINPSLVNNFTAVSLYLS